MAPIFLTYEQIVAIIEQIVAAGERPTINRIREALGNQGPVPIIARFLKQWRAANGQQLSLDMVNEMPLQPEKQPVQQQIKMDMDDQQPATFAPSASEQTPSSVFSEPPVAPFQLPVVEEEREPTTPQQQQHNQNQRSQQQPQHQRGRRNFDRNQQQPQQQAPATPPPPKVVDFDKPYPAMPQDVQEFLDQPLVSHETMDVNSIESLVALTKEALITKVRYLSSLVTKEQKRTDVSERIARESRIYSDGIKNMVAERINAIRDSMQVSIDQLKLELRQNKANAEKELLRYQQQLDAANRKLVELLPPTQPNTTI